MTMSKVKLHREIESSHSLSGEQALNHIYAMYIFTYVEYYII
jgi:hypothetical protein